MHIYNNSWICKVGAPSSSDPLLYIILKMHWHNNSTPLLFLRLEKRAKKFFLYFFPELKVLVGWAEEV